MLLLLLDRQLRWRDALTGIVVLLLLPCILELVHLAIDQELLLHLHQVESERFRGLSSQVGKVLDVLVRQFELDLEHADLVFQVVDYFYFRIYVFLRDV